MSLSRKNVNNIICGEIFGSDDGKLKLCAFGLRAKDGLITMNHIIAVNFAQGNKMYT